MTDRSVVYRIRAEVTQFKAQMAAASASVQTAADKMTAADKSAAKFRDGLSTVGVTGGKIGLVAAAGLGAAVVKAANFDQAMSNVSAATRESAANMDLLRQAALKAGAQTVFSATEAADGIEQLAKAGVSTKDILAGGLSGALSLAAAGGQSVGDAAETAATALTQFKLSGEDIPHIADLLAAGAGKAQGEVSDLAAALKQSGLVASQMGISIEDTTGTLAAFASAGLLGSDAGTSFKSMLQRLSNPIGQGAEAMKALGISAYDAQGNFIGIAAVASQLQDKLGGLTQAQRDAALAQIFGSDAVRAASVLYDQGAAGIQGWIDKTNDSGYAAETAAKKMDNLKGDLENFSGALETALIGTGSGSQGPLRSLVQDLTSVVNAYNKLPQGAKSATGATLGFVAAAGGGLFVFSKLVSGLANTREAMGQLGVSAGRTGSILRTATNVSGALLGLELLDQALDQVFNKNIDSSKLSRSLDALASGTVTGEIANKFGKDLDGFSEQLGAATANATALSRTVGKIPLVGGFLSGDFLPKDVESGVQNIKAIDDALAGMVESGQQAEAAKVFDVLSEEARSAGISATDVSKGFEQYKLAVKNAATEATTATGAQGALATATGRAASASSLAASIADDQAAALEATRKAATTTAQSFVGLGDSLNDSKTSLSQWIRQLSEQADALNNFTNNSVKAATRGLNDGLIKALQEAGPEGALRMKQLASGTDKEITRANRAWRKGQRAVDDYTDAVTGVPASKSTNVTEKGAEPAKKRIKAMRDEIAGIRSKIVNMDERGAAAARARISNLRAEIRALQSKTITITTVRQNRGASGNVGRGAAADASARGNLFPSVQAFARGGFPDDIANGHQPKMYPPGPTRFFREPETQGEVYIPLASDSRRPRARSLVEDTAAIFGGEVEWYARGGRNGGAATSTSSPRASRLREFEAALARSTKTLQRETSARESMISKRSELSSSVSGAFTSDLFAGSSVWAPGGGAGSAIGTLMADIAKAKAFQQTLAQLSKSGLNGDALAAVASTGDYGKAQGLLSLGKSGLAQYETLYNQRAAAAASVGAYAGNVAYSADIAASTKHLASVNAQIKQLNAQIKQLRRENGRHAKTTGRETGKAVNSAAGNAKRRGRG